MEAGQLAELLANPAAGADTLTKDEVARALGYAADSSGR
jgi:hypothetical protein